MTIGNIMENLMQDKDGYSVTQSFNINSVLGRTFLQWAEYRSKWYHRHNVYDDIKESLDLTKDRKYDTGVPSYNTKSQVIQSLALSTSLMYALDFNKVPSVSWPSAQWWIGFGGTPIFFIIVGKEGETGKVGRWSWGLEKQKNCMTFFYLIIIKILSQLVLWYIMIWYLLYNLTLFKTLSNH